MTDWKKEVECNSAPSEIYTMVWSQCRNFVLPMNPQRTELEYAIRYVLKDLGVGVYLPKKKKTSSNANNSSAKKTEPERKKKRYNKYNSEKKNVKDLASLPNP